MSSHFDQEKSNQKPQSQIIDPGDRSRKSYFPKLREQIRPVETCHAQLEASRASAQTNEAWLQSILKTTPVGIAVVADRKVQFVNETMCRILGYSREEITGHSTRLLYPSEHEYTWADDTITRQIKRDKTASAELRFQRSDGSIIDVLLTGCPIDASDFSKGISFSVLEITERKKMIEAFRHSEEKYRELVENIDEVIFMTDTKGIVSFISPVIESMMGYKPVEITGRLYTDFIYRKDIDQIRDCLKTSFQGNAGSNQYRFVNKFGMIKWTRTSVRPVYNEGKIIGMTGTIVDISEQKALEAELAQARKLESIGTLAGGIAHDFNNILSGIIGFTELSLNRAGQNIELTRYFNEILKACERAKNLVKQILTFSRKQTENVTDISLPPIVREATQFLRSTIPASIEFQVNIQSNQDHVNANPAHIHQVIMNLCTNAIHALEKKGGKLTVSLYPVDLDETFTRHYQKVNPGKFIKLSVKDTGHGIPQEIIPSIFDPYFTTKKTGEGSGLGLSMVHGIVNNYGGIITVSSQPGHGSSFDVFFPAVKQKNKTKPTNLTDELPRGKERILFVDDEAIITRTGKLRLEYLGYHVDSETCGMDAIKHFQSAPETYDLIITDMTMPKMTGDRLTREIKKIRPDIPVILCTGFSHITPEEAKEIGINAFLLKPLRIKKMAETIRRVLDEAAAGRFFSEGTWIC